ncbi:MAG TPA: type II toxin-antitoxin system VapC family toxin [Rhizomicrobium sp.]|nr:type II toxin-antitoxin system VapC family toxin [Rhizomicrobium sp.]
MLAADTNVLVRFITADDPTQSRRARALIAANDIFVATTVLLETEWVLRSAYKFTVDDVADALTAFAGLPQIKLENPEATAKALDWLRNGMDFADALHLAASADCEAFASFDESLMRKAKAAGATPVRRP